MVKPSGYECGQSSRSLGSARQLRTHRATHALSAQVTLPDSSIAAPTEIVSLICFLHSTVGYFAQLTIMVAGWRCPLACTRSYAHVTNLQGHIRAHRRSLEDRQEARMEDAKALLAFASQPVQASSDEDEDEDEDEDVSRLHPVLAYVQPTY